MRFICQPYPYKCIYSFSVIINDSFLGTKCGANCLEYHVFVHTHITIFIPHKLGKFSCDRNIILISTQRYLTFPQRTSFILKPITQLRRHGLRKRLFIILLQYVRLFLLYPQRIYFKPRDLNLLLRY